MIVVPTRPLPMREHTDDVASLPGVFVCGRQHSGNSLVTLLVGKLRGWISTQREGVFYEHRKRLDALPDAVARAQWMGHHLYLNQPEIERQIASDLLEWAQEHADADAVAVFQRAMALMASSLGKRAWARKATSYIFHAGEILALMPNVKIVYMLRNPFDVCASKKLREPRREHIVGWALSWNRGVELARQCKEQFPQRVHIVRYEELVMNPQRTVAAICDFLGEDFDPDLLDVPHINPSDRPHQIVEGSQGLDQSRLYYYSKHLSAAEVQALRILCARDLLETHYPDLACKPADMSLLTRIRALGLIGAGFVRYPIEIAIQARRFRLPVRAYMMRRLGVLLRRKVGACAAGPTVRPAFCGLLAIVLGLIIALAEVAAIR